MRFCCIRLWLYGGQQLLGVFAHPTAEIEVSRYLATQFLDRPSAFDALCLVEETGRRVFLCHYLAKVRERKSFNYHFWGCRKFVRQRRMNFHLVVFQFIRCRRMNLSNQFVRRYCTFFEQFCYLRIKIVQISQ